MAARWEKRGETGGQTAGNWVGRGDDREGGGVAIEWQHTGRRGRRGTSGETAGHTTKRGQASKAERKNEIMTIEILKIFNS